MRTNERKRKNNLVGEGFIIWHISHHWPKHDQPKEENLYKRKITIHKHPKSINYTKTYEFEQYCNWKQCTSVITDQNMINLKRKICWKERSQFSQAPKIYQLHQNLWVWSILQLKPMHINRNVFYYEKDYV